MPESIHRLDRLCLPVRNYVTFILVQTEVAANIDIKGFREKAHRKYMGGRLQPTLDATEYLVEQDVHVEITYLTIPDLNDDPEEIREFADWVASIDPSIPVHFSRFHPDHEMRDRPATPLDTLEMAHSIATDAGLEFVYVGNIRDQRFNSTTCPDCGQTWIRRTGFDSTAVGDLSTPCECGRAKNVVP